jgi:hypothetical protein
MRRVVAFQEQRWNINLARQNLLIPLAQARAFLAAAEQTGGIIEVETSIGVVRFFPSKYGEQMTKLQSAPPPPVKKEIVRL